MKCKHWVVFLIITLVITNVYQASIVFDNGVTLTYQEASLESTIKSYEQALRIANLNLLGKSANEARMLLGKDVYELDPFEKEGCLYAGQVCLRLNESGVITSVGNNAL